MDNLFSGYIDQVKIRIRTHAPNNVTEKEFTNITEAKAWLNSVQSEKVI
jgi:hypothetical protein